MLKLRFPLPVFRNAREIANGRNARMALKGLVANRAALIISLPLGVLSTLNKSFALLTHKVSG